MLKRRSLLYAATGIVVLAVGAFALAYFVFFPTDSPEKFSLSEAEATPTATATSAATETAGAAKWTVAEGSEAGYRVREKLAFLPAKNDAVGRTSDITGEAESTGDGDALTFTTASFEIDLTTLTSDENRRDQRIREIGIESARFPTATFALAEPLELSSGKVDATGDLTLHGVKKRVTIPLEVRQSGSTVEAVGSLTFPWGDFDMTAPSVAGFVNVEDEATLEFDLKLERG
jgi:polyisoprenoid-binding protein YceI